MEIKKLTEKQIKTKIEDHEDTLDGLRKPDGTYPAEDTVYATEQRAKLDTLRMELHKRREKDTQVSPR
jgi:hypothetical protein